MDLIPSFKIDHTRLMPGIYISRQDTISSSSDRQSSTSLITTYDIRMKRPNVEPAIHPNAIHTIEHVIATYLRNDLQWKDRIVYWGPMGCLTGNYLIVKGRPTPQEIYPLVLRAFEYLRDYDGEVPGATVVNCGNCILHDLQMAKYEAAKFVETLKKRPSFDYPMMNRIKTDDGAVFFDS